MTILVKPWKNRIDGRILVFNVNKVVFSIHFRDQEHKIALINQIRPLLQGE